jgi:hypothetical protein
MRCREYRKGRKVPHSRHPTFGLEHAHEHPRATLRDDDALGATSIPVWPAKKAQLLNWALDQLLAPDLGTGAARDIEVLIT